MAAIRKAGPGVEAAKRRNEFRWYRGLWAPTFERRAQLLHRLIRYRTVVAPDDLAAWLDHHQVSIVRLLEPRRLLQFLLVVKTSTKRSYSSLGMLPLMACDTIPRMSRGTSSVTEMHQVGYCCLKR